MYAGEEDVDRDPRTFREGLGDSFDVFLAKSQKSQLLVAWSHTVAATPSPKNKRKRSETEDSDTSKPDGPAAEESSPEDGDAFDPYGDAGSVSSGEKEEEEELAVTGTAPTSTSNTVILSEENRAAADSSPPQQMVDTSTPPPSPRAPSPKRLKPLMDQFICLGSQYIGFRNEANILKASLQRAEERAEALEAKLKISEETREKAQAIVASVEELRQRLSKAESALSDKITEHIAREQGMIDRLAQSRRFFHKLFLYLEAFLGLFSWMIMIMCFAATGRNDERFELIAPKDDRLLDAISILELQGDLARTNLSDSRAAFSRLFPHFFPSRPSGDLLSLVKRSPKEDLAGLSTGESKIGVKGTIAVANSGRGRPGQSGNTGKIKKDKWKAPVKDAKPHSKKIIDFFTPKPAGSTRLAKTEVK
ncbi:hypothetical protein QYE76_022146 [Lolium multiflorum]|uniref:Uncharacterized protein n=1 Tax=Lolium multiflorum TaxID=4521 RepID=A0AAD8RAY5_LOLMU|nr:hypothetical protein QYE76_022146 [Lolium multiflorum]